VTINNHPVRGNRGVNYVETQNVKNRSFAYRAGKTSFRAIKKHRVGYLT
jgi:hypothetical protein